MPQENFALRLDWDVGIAERKTQLSSWLDKYGSRYLVVYETHEGENPHVHAFFTSEKSMNTLRVSLKRTFEWINGNGSYSLKECDEKHEDYLRYMCKGDGKDEKPVVLVSQGFEFSEDEIAKWHEEYWVTNSLLTANKKKRSEVLLRGTMVEQIEKICKEKGVRSREDISREYIRLYRELRKPINIFQARSVVNTVILLLCPDSREEDILVGAICNN